jgi:hypothetical protein
MELKGELFPRLVGLIPFHDNAWGQLVVHSPASAAFPHYDWLHEPRHGGAASAAGLARCHSPIVAPSGPMSWRRSHLCVEQTSSQAGLNRGRYHQGGLHGRSDA